MRPPSQFDTSALLAYASPLVGITQYKKMAFNDELPAYANCITAVRHLVKNLSGLRIPNVWVGDIPYAMSHKKWRALSIERQQLQAGDLLFTYRENRITHVAIALDLHSIFHCTLHRGAVIDSLEDFLKEYPSPFKTPDELLDQRDPRAYLLKQWEALPISKV